MSIQVEQLNYSIGKRAIIKNISFMADKGKITAIIGKSGSGKTSLLNCISGLLKPNSGKVLFSGLDTTNWKEKEWLKFWKSSVAFVYQDHGIIEDETVAYNLTFHNPSYIFKRKNINSVAKKTLEKVGLKERQYDLASYLSGGERQRLGIARALYRNAKYLFVDEPTASLDQQNKLNVLELLRYAADQGSTIIMATHDELAIRYADKVISLDDK